MVVRVERRGGVGQGADGARQMLAGEEVGALAEERGEGGEIVGGLGRAGDRGEGADGNVATLGQLDEVELVRVGEGVDEGVVEGGVGNGMGECGGHEGPPGSEKTGERQETTGKADETRRATEGDGTRRE